MNSMKAEKEVGDTIRYVIVGTNSHLQVKVWGIFRSENGAEKHVKTLSKTYPQFDMLVVPIVEDE